MKSWRWWIYEVTATGMHLSTSFFPTELKPVPSWSKPDVKPKVLVLFHLQFKAMQISFVGKSLRSLILKLYFTHICFHPFFVCLEEDIFEWERKIRVLQSFLLFLQDIYTHGLLTWPCGEHFVRIHVNALTKSHCRLWQPCEEYLDLRKCWVFPDH